MCGACLQVNSLRELVEDWYFDEGPFMEFVAPALQVLAGLLHSSGELETQLQVCCIVLAHHLLHESGIWL